MCCVCHVVLRDGVLREPACGGRARREAGAEGAGQGGGWGTGFGGGERARSCGA